MNFQHISATINVTAGDTVLCPICHKTINRTAPETRADNLPLFCKRCKREFKVNIVEPEPLSLSQ